MTAKAADYLAIVRVVQLYIDGFQGDVNKFKEAFHQDAWIFYTDPEGVLHRNLIAESFEYWAGEKKHIVGRFVSVTQAGDVANVLLRLDNPTNPKDSWADLHALIRVDGVWKITNKTATHHSRDGGV